MVFLARRREHFHNWALFWSILWHLPSVSVRVSVASLRRRSCVRTVHSIGTSRCQNLNVFEVRSHQIAWYRSVGSIDNVIKMVVPSKRRCLFYHALDAVGRWFERKEYKYLDGDGLLLCFLSLVLLSGDIIEGVQIILMDKIYVFIFFCVTLYLKYYINFNIFIYLFI